MLHINNRPDIDAAITATEQAHEDYCKKWHECNADAERLENVEPYDHEGWAEHEKLKEARDAAMEQRKQYAAIAVDLILPALSDAQRQIYDRLLEYDNKQPRLVPVNAWEKYLILMKPLDDYHVLSIDQYDELEDALCEADCAIEYFLPREFRDMAREQEVCRLRHTQELPPAAVSALATAGIHVCDNPLMDA